MRRAFIHSACALALACAALPACSKDSRRPTVSAAEQRRIDERRAEERLAAERRDEARLAEERRAEERRAERRADERRADERVVAERLADQRRVEEKRADERRDARQARSGVDPVVRATAASAVTTLAAERCDREVRCKNIGAKEKYKSRTDCIAEMERDKRDDLNSDVCPGGIRQKELNDCLQAIHDEACGNPLDTLTRLAACRSGNLCAK